MKTARSSAQHHLRHPKFRALLGWSLAALVMTGTLALTPPLVFGETATASVSLRAPTGTAYVAAHRGDAIAPENTMPAVLAAIESGADFIEVDVQLTADGVPVLMHDWTVDRTTDGTGFVWELDFREVRALDAGSWLSPAHAGVGVATLKQFLDALRGSDAWAIVELKGSWSVTQLAVVHRLVAQAGAEGRVVLASFDIMTVRNAAIALPNVQRALVTRTITGDPTVLAEAAGASALIVSHRFARSSPDVVHRAQLDGISVFAYTVNDADDWSRALAAGIDGIITDSPSGLATWFAKQRAGR